MTPILCFDIETIPDTDGLRKLLPLPAGASDAEVAEAAFAARRQKTGGSDFLALHLHRVVAIACLFRDQDGVRVRSIGQAADGEAKLIQDFYRIIERYTPQMVSWNGGGFDLQVLQYRGLIHRVQAPRYWENGEDDRDFKWNSYISRYHWRHLDLMDLLALFTPRANAPLDELAKLCGFPGKLGMDGSQVWSSYQQDGLEEIRAYCETDVANTYLMYCRFQLMRGIFSQQAYDDEVALLRSTLDQQAGTHWREFLAAWPT